MHVAVLSLIRHDFARGLPLLFCRRLVEYKRRTLFNVSQRIIMTIFEALNEREENIFGEEGREKFFFLPSNNLYLRITKYLKGKKN